MPVFFNFIIGTWPDLNHLNHFKPTFNASNSINFNRLNSHHPFVHNKFHFPDMIQKAPRRKLNDTQFAPHFKNTFENFVPLPVPFPSHPSHISHSKIIIKKSQCPSINISQQLSFPQHLSIPTFSGGQVVRTQQTVKCCGRCAQH